MARKARLRKERLYTIRLYIVGLLFMLVLISGLAAVDFSKNYVLYGQSSMEIIKIDRLDKDIYSLSILNDRINLNLKYLKRDLNRLKNTLLGWKE